jgi:hypothetical protein
LPRLRHRHVPVRLLLFLITVEAVTAHKEEVEGAETHEMDILGSHAGSVASSLRSASTDQDINEAQSVVPQAERVTSIFPCCLILRRLFFSITGSGGSDISEMNINQTCSRDDVSRTTSDRPTQAEAQTRAYFVTVVEISMT